MKIGLLTFHAALNYGSALQAYALQEYLSERGHDVRIIDFQSIAKRRLYPAALSLNSIYNTKCTIRRMFSDWGEIVSMTKKHQAFGTFMKRHMNLTDQKYQSEKGLLREDWSSYDMLICGSDQIWNISALDASEAYFLNFTDAVRKVSYAPSAGQNPQEVFSSLDKDGLSALRRYIHGFESVSVRESKTAEALFQSGLMSEPPVVLPDPVLLHDGGFYTDSICEDGQVSSKRKQLEEGSYILFYSPGRKNVEAEMLADAAAAGMLGKGASSINSSDTRKEIIRVSDGAAAGAGFHNALPCGPGEFVNLIRNAYCTVGTSFHLMVFSMLLGKDFICPDVLSDSRKKDLLERLGMASDGVFFHFNNPEVRCKITSALAPLRAQADAFFSQIGI